MAGLAVRFRTAVCFCTRGRLSEVIEEARSALEKAYSDRGYQAVSVAIPPQTVRDFAYTIRSAGVAADYREMTSAHGHDAFLAEQAELVRLLQ